MILTLRLAALALILAAVPATAADWQLFVSNDAPAQAWQLFGRSDAPPAAAAAPGDVDAWQLFAAQSKQKQQPADSRPVVDVDCPEGDWCTACLRWQHDPRVPENEWIETDSLPFQLRFNKVPDDRHRAYPAFRFIVTDGRQRTYLGPARSTLIAVWKKYARDAQ